MALKKEAYKVDRFFTKLYIPGHILERQVMHVV